MEAAALFASSGMDLARAEFALLRAEIDENLRSQFRALLIAGIALGLIIIALACGAVALAMVLAPYVGGPAASYAIIAGVTLVCAIIFLLIARNMLSLQNLLPHRFMDSLSRVHFGYREDMHERG
jgi:hypothetical protein